MFNLIAVFFVCSGIGIAVHIAYDLTSHKQSMKIMNVVWILTALWGSYLALWAYNKFGQSKTSKMVMPEQEMTDESMKMDMNMEMEQCSSTMAVRGSFHFTLWGRMYISRYYRRVDYTLYSYKHWW